MLRVCVTVNTNMGKHCDRQVVRRTARPAHGGQRAAGAVTVQGVGVGGPPSRDRCPAGAGQGGRAARSAWPAVADALL